MIKALLTRLAETARDGVMIWRLAPIIPALIVLPEFAQHIAEIQLGMFEGKEQAATVSQHPTRWAFGYAKLAGLALATLATIRFWGTRFSGEAWWDLRKIGWRAVLVALALMVAATLPGTFGEPYFGAETAGWINIGLTLATLPLLALLVRGLSGDRQTTLRSIFRNGWFASIRLVVFAAIFWAPLQWLHGQMHEWAIGSSIGYVWTLMIVDSFIVGLIATYAGTAFHHGSRPLDESLPPAQQGSI